MEMRLVLSGVTPEVVALILVGAALLGTAVFIRKRMKFH